MRFPSVFTGWISASGQSLAGFVEAARDGAVPQVRADLHSDASDDRGVDGELDTDGATVDEAELGGELAFTGLVERSGHGHVRHGLVARRPGGLDEGIERGVEAATADAVARGDGQLDR